MKSLFAGVFFVGFLIYVFHSGCGKKEEPPAVSTDASAVEAAALPELEQNKMYLNNPVVTLDGEEPAFEPAEDDLQKLSEEEAALLGPPAD